MKNINTVDGQREEIREQIASENRAKAWANPGAWLFEAEEEAQFQALPDATAKAEVN